MGGFQGFCCEEAINQGKETNSSYNLFSCLECQSSYQLYKGACSVFPKPKVVDITKNPYYQWTVGLTFRQRDFS